ncbi:GIY-YIG nuclease family protein [Castellaniella sp.]|uniref:GIY-YIG nuclease family protein n=1 Tax=Castellaniella sp. TaxID=1955812 RepID=UPI002AFEFA98|nr:GIY-YIG nuclease family protein [Castellaniella sp.]
MAEITTRIVQAIEVPRSLLSDFIAMPESDQVAVYFLFGQGEDGASQKLYVGQTGDLRKRLVKHNKEKDFWQRAVVLISRTNSLTQTHALFLEWLCIQQAKVAGRYLTENGNDGSKPHTPAPLEADCHEIFDTGRTLLATLGYPVFEPLASNKSQSLKTTELFYCNRAGVKAVGEYTEEGFVVLKGSVGKGAVGKAHIHRAYAKQRDALMQEGKVALENGVLVFKEDVLFGTPSGAAAAIVGSAANGWREWKNQQGVTLDELKRGNVSATTEE